MRTAKINTIFEVHRQYRNRNGIEDEKLLGFINSLDEAEQAITTYVMSDFKLIVKLQRRSKIILTSIEIDEPCETEMDHKTAFIVEARFSYSDKDGKKQESTCYFFLYPITHLSKYERLIDKNSINLL